MISLTKKFRFETAHRLSKGYDGKCANIHGHSWNGSITVLCDELDEKDMGVDYSVIGKFCKEVESLFDHKLLLWEKDPMIDWLIENSPVNGVVPIWKNPTSEALAEYIFKMAVAYFYGMSINCTVFKVQIDETCTTECVYENANYYNEMIKNIQDGENTGAING